MRATNRLGLCFSLLLACGWVNELQAGTPGPALGMWLLGDAPRQATSEEDRSRCETLLKQAREAMRTNNFSLAEKLVADAEATKVEFSLLHVGDTPKKARRDLDAKRAIAEKLSKRPSLHNKPADVQQITEDAHATAVATLDAAHPVETSLAPTDEVDRLPLPTKKEGTNRSAFAATAAPPETVADRGLNAEVVQGVHPVASAEARRQSDESLLAARRAMAVGDLRRARDFLDKAKGFSVTYAAGEDGPARVEAAIRRHHEVFFVASSSDAEGLKRQKSDTLLEEAQAMIRRQQFDDAQQLASEAARLNAHYSRQESSPTALLARISEMRRQQSTNASAAGAVMPAGGEVVQASGQGSGEAAQAVFDIATDQTQNRPASATTPPARLAQAPAATQAPEQEAVPTQDAMDLIRQGEESLRRQDKEHALQSFRKAYTLRDQLDPATARRLQDHLQLLSAPAAMSAADRLTDNLLDDAAQQQKMLQRQLGSEVTKQIEAGRKQLNKDPRGAIDTIKQAKLTVQASGVDQQFRSVQLAKLDHVLAEFDKYVSDNRAQIELDEENKAVLSDVERRRTHRREVETKLAALVDEHNRLNEEHRYEEAELVAKKARELDPENPLALQLVRNSALVRNMAKARDLEERKQEGFVNTLNNVELASISPDSDKPYQFPDVKDWNSLVNRRKGKYGEKSRLNERELEIQRKLSTPVEAKYTEQPLGEVLHQLAELAGVNLHIDQNGLAQEGWTLETPVTLNLTQEVQLKSALNVILEPLHLTYIIKNEVLKITSESQKAGEHYPVTYYVADLVMPIPNFVPSSNMGMAGALHDAHQHLGVGANSAGFGGPTAVVASRDGKGGTAAIDSTVLAQMRPNSPNGFGQSTTPSGPGGAGGAVQADFDSLIDLITQTVQPDSWTEGGGTGTVTRFPLNNSLVISNTQEAHEQVADLLEQLRRLQDLQVTIEVRFITLNDRFFERIGVDFQFNVEDNTHAPLGDLKSPASSIGLDGSGATRDATGLPAVSTDRDIQFRSGSFGLSVPAFGGFDAASNPGGRFGFAILSDIEAYFLVSAAQADTRSNVLQAPKVTLFNGQQAFVSDRSETPFVVSVIPVVGDFAAAQQPVIVVLSEGTFLTVSAVVSSNRQYVRLTVIPFFSQIDKVDTFTFTGEKTTTKGSTKSNSTGGNTGTSATDQSNETTTTSGVTLQLPTFSSVSVTTTVSVPDGGTVLLGGIKRLSEGRNEFGVPILSKLPYINRLFKNVGIGRDTQSLMMMVTPRIIIQDEEEDRLGIEK